MLETSARLLRLLSLLQVRREWTGTDLAQELGVTPRTVRRDVEKLRNLGYPVHASPGVAGGYQLGAGASLPPLLLDDDEAVAVAVGLRTAAGGTVTGIEETSVRALTKLEQVLPSRLRHRVNALQSVVVPVATGGPAIDPDTLTVVATACRESQQLRFDYRSHDGAESRRTVEPYRLAHTGRRWYLVGWDTSREDWRTYRVDRIQPLPPAGPRFTPRELPDADIAAYISRGVSTAAYHYRGRFTIHAPAEVVAEQIRPTAGVVEAIDEHSCTLHTGANTLDQLAIYIPMLGFEFEVHDPPELVDHIHSLIDRLTRAVGERATEV